MRQKKKTKPDPDPEYGGLFTRDEARLLKLAELFPAYAKTSHNVLDFDLAQEMMRLCEVLRDPFKAPEQMTQHMEALKRFVDWLHEAHQNAADDD